MRLEVEGAADLLRMEYAEMPGLQLTFWQVQRLCNLSDDLCESALALLMRSRFLVRTGDGQYRRPHPDPRRQSAATSGVQLELPAR